MYIPFSNKSGNLAIKRKSRAFSPKVSFGKIVPEMTCKKKRDAVAQ